MVTRREVLLGSVAALGSAALISRSSLAEVSSDLNDQSATNSPYESLGYTPVTTPNGSTLKWKMIGDVKVFHLIAEPVKREFAKNLVVDCWGYNGQTPGPTIEVVEGDKCRFFVTNNLPEPTTVHWHGIILPNGMDGVAGLNQKAIEPGETFKYEFTVKHPGTFMYHPHFDEMVQMGLGMQGMFIVHPKGGKERVDRDFVFMLSEWRIDPGTSRPNPIEMTDFNVLTLNSKVFPATEPIVAKLGDRVRVRIGNLSAMDHHPIHLHGYSFKVTRTDGGRIPDSAQWPETTVLVPVGSTRDFEFVADNLGDWAMHCHMTHHVMNQMGHDLPNMLGVKSETIDKKVTSILPEYMSMGTGGMGEMMMMGAPKNSIPMVGGKGRYGTIDMGGMFTVLKVREDISSYDADIGWYDNPNETLAQAATAEELRTNGISVSSRQRKKTAGEKVYVCPMHSDVTSKSPGQCPKCGMTLVEK